MTFPERFLIVSTLITGFYFTYRRWWFCKENNQFFLTHLHTCLYLCPVWWTVYRYATSWSPLHFPGKFPGAVCRIHFQVPGGSCYIRHRLFYHSSLLIQSATCNYLGCWAYKYFPVPANILHQCFQTLSVKEREYGNSCRDSKCFNGEVLNIWAQRHRPFKW